MELKYDAKVVKGVGGSYEVRLSSPDAAELSRLGIDPDRLICRARGAFRHERLTVLPGDDAVIRIDTDVALADHRRTDRPSRDETRGGIMIDGILPRKNELIRPPMANLDLLFIVIAAAKPEPSLTTADKLITTAEFKSIEPVIVITKADLSPEGAKRLSELYRKCGFKVFTEGIGIDADELSEFIRSSADRTSAFAGASGVGKSTLMNRLFPSLGLTTGAISEKTGRGKHTTRHIELYPLSAEFGDSAAGYLADTPGFGMLDFVQFDFYTKDDLPYVFREFAPYIGKCRYTKCSHTKEDGCAILEAVRRGDIPEERHRSYLEFYETLKNKHEWKN